jgi:hypothetical protein
MDERQEITLLYLEVLDNTRKLFDILSVLPPKTVSTSRISELHIFLSVFANQIKKDCPLVHEDLPDISDEIRNWIICEYQLRMGIQLINVKKLQRLRLSNKISEPNLEIGKVLLSLIIESITKLKEYLPTEKFEILFNGFDKSTLGLYKGDLFKN